MRILIADQNALLLAAIASTFGRHCEIVTATRRDACIAHLERERFDVVVACEKLRDYTGLELLSEIESVSPHTLRIFSAPAARLTRLQSRLDHFRLLGTLSYPIEPRKLLLALKVARTKLPAKPKVQHVVLESEWDTGERLGLLEQELEVAPADPPVLGEAATQLADAHPPAFQEANSVSRTEARPPALAAPPPAAQTPDDIPVFESADASVSLVRRVREIPSAEVSFEVSFDENPNRFDATAQAHGVRAQTRPGPAAQTGAAHTNTSRTSSAQTRPHAPATPSGQSGWRTAATSSAESHPHAPAASISQTHVRAPATSSTQTHPHAPATSSAQSHPRAPSTSSGQTHPRTSAASSAQTRPSNPAAPKAQTPSRAPAAPSPQSRPPAPAAPAPSTRSPALLPPSSPGQALFPDEEDPDETVDVSFDALPQDFAVPANDPSVEEPPPPPPPPPPPVDTGGAANDPKFDTGPGPVEPSPAKPTAKTAGAKTQQGPTSKQPIAPKGPTGPRPRKPATPTAAQREAFQRAVARRNAARLGGANADISDWGTGSNGGGQDRVDAANTGSFKPHWHGTHSLSDLAGMAATRRPLKSTQRQQPNRKVFVVGSGVAAVLLASVLAFELTGSNATTHHGRRVNAAQLFSPKSNLVAQNTAEPAQIFAPPPPPEQQTSSPTPNSVALPQPQVFDPDTAPPDPPPPPALEHPGPMEPPSMGHNEPPIGMQGPVTD